VNIDAPMHNPRTSVIRLESKGDIVTSASTDANNVSSDRVRIVIRGAAGAPDNIEGMLLSQRYG